MVQGINFALKLRLALVRFLPMLTYHMYVPLDKNLHIAQSINFSSKIGIATYNANLSIAQRFSSIWTRTLMLRIIKKLFVLFLIFAT